MEICSIILPIPSCDGAPLVGPISQHMMPPLGLFRTWSSSAPAILLIGVQFPPLSGLIRAFKLGPVPHLFYQPSIFPMVFELISDNCQKKTFFHCLVGCTSRFDLSQRVALFVLSVVGSTINTGSRGGRRRRGRDGLWWSKESFFVRIRFGGCMADKGVRRSRDSELDAPDVPSPLKGIWGKSSPVSSARKAQSLLSRQALLSSSSPTL